VAAGIAVLVRLATQTLRGTLATDECFHATVAEWIALHRAIPAELPELYSGFFYYYQPLLHLVGSAWVALAGPERWLGLPVVFAVLLFATLASGGFGTVPGRAGRWTAVLVVAHPALASMSVRLYVEPLITLLFVWGVLLLFRARRGGWPAALALGLVLGLALLAKLNAWSLWIGVAAAALWDVLRGERARARRLAVACALGLAICVPWLVRNQILFGSALYPAFAPDLDAGLYALNTARFSTPPAQFLAALPRVLGPWCLALVAAALGMAIARRRWTLRESVAVGALVAMIFTAFVPLAAGRHLNPLIAVIALLSVWGVTEALATRPLARLGIGIAVLGIAVHGLLQLPDFRRMADPPEYLRHALPQVASHTPPDARILSLWTYDTYYATRRAATWPNPWGQRSRPLGMFLTGDADSILAHLRASGITHVLAPTRARPGAFDSANYPEPFLQGLDRLMRLGAVRLVWQSRDLALLEISLRGAKPDTLPAEPPHSRSPG